MNRRAFCFTALAGSAALAAEPLRVLIVTGGHDHPPSFYGQFDNAQYDAVVDPYPNAFRKDIRKYDVVVTYDMIPELSPEQQGNIREFLAMGKGMVVLHHAICGNADWSWWHTEVLGGKYLLTASEGQPASTYKHDQTLNVKVRKKHRITEGLTDFTIEDETYKGMQFAKGIDILLTTDHPTSDGPLAWVGPNASYRVAYIQLGHGTPAHRNPNYRRLVSNAVAWAAKR